VAEASLAVESAAAFFLDFDFFVVVVVAVSVAAADWSLVAAASALAFFFDFFCVPLSAGVWSVVLVCGFAKAGATNSASRRHTAAIHGLGGSLFIKVLVL
jgi:hypothetical protein